MNKQIKRTTLNAKGNVIVQIMSGENVDVLVDGETIYVPMAEVSLKPLADVDDEPTAEIKDAPAPKSSTKKAPTKKVEAEAEAENEAAADGSLPPLTLEELMDITASDIQKSLEDAGIEIPSDGRNTHKKMRELYLESMDSDVEQEEEEEEAPAPKSKSKSKGRGKSSAKKELSLGEKLLEVISVAYETAEDGDADAAVETIKKLAGKDAAADAEQAFNDAWADEESTADSCADAVEAAINGEGADELEESDAPEGEEVTVDKLKVGDRVSCFWEKDADDNVLNDWYDGEVTELEKKGRKVIGAYVAYDDDEDTDEPQPIDGELVKRIVILSE